MRIGITGTQSVGKSVLVREIEKRCLLPNYNFFTERSKELMMMGVPLNRESTYEGQLIFFTERVKELLNDNMLTDRTAIDVWVFARVSNIINNHNKCILRNIFNSLADKYDILFYIPIQNEIKMEDNGIRETDENYRKLIDKNIKGVFDRYKGKKHIIKNITLDGRVNEIMNCIKQLEEEK